MRGLASEFLEERVRPLPDPVQRAGAVERHAHDPALLRERLQDRLPDPPDRVGDELDSLGLVELMGGADQPEVPLIDQIE